MKVISQNLKIEDADLMKIVSLLRKEGAQIRLVGGAVRDALLKKNIKDIDLATDFQPNEVIKILSKQKINVIPTGINFGTVTIVINGKHFEITSLRKDISCDGRHAQVKYTKNFQEDANRRDFTINALSYCPIEHKIYDYFNGIEDLNNSKVVFIGNPNERIKEDFLRILRFFRFSSGYAKIIDQQALEACVKFKSNLNNIAKERIKSEFDKILKYQNSANIVNIMFKKNILQEIFPIKDHDNQVYIKALEIFKKLNLKIDIFVIYALLFIKSEYISIKTLLDLKFSKQEAKIIFSLLELKKLQKEVEILNKLKYIWVKNKNYEIYFVFLSSIIQKNQFILDLFNELKTKSKPIFPINGNDLIKIGYKNNKIGNAIKFLEKKWIDNHFLLNKIQLINLLKNNDKIL